jgi:hypothetical protein
MLRRRFLVEGLGSVKKFHSLTNHSSEREFRDKPNDAEVEDIQVRFDKGTREDKKCSGTSPMMQK